MDGAWPDPISIVRDREDVGDADKRAVLVDGPAEYYGIDIDGLLAHLGAGWDLNLPIAQIPNMYSPDYVPRRGYADAATR